MNKIKILMTSTLIVTIAIVMAVLYSVLHGIPSKVYVDDNSNICLKSVIGSFGKFPVDKIVMRDVPEGAKETLIILLRI